MGSLIDEADSVLVVIDVQPGFLRKVDPAVAADVEARVRWLVEVAVRLGVPVVVTEEEPGYHGSVPPSIIEVLPADTVRHVKPTFGLAFSPEILDAVTATGRRTAVLCGLETDVCVAQSAIGLHDLGWRVAVVRDAVASPMPAHQHGLDRLVQVGVPLVGLKSLYYEWARSVERLAETRDIWHRPPPGLTM